MTIVRCSRKYLFLKYGRKIRAKFLEMLQAAIFFSGFPVLMAGSLRQVLRTYSGICLFCRAIQYMVSQKQPVGSAHEVLAKSSETVFDEAHFIVNLHSFLRPQALSRHTFPLSEPFVPHPPRQSNFQNSSFLDTSETALVCIFYSILNHG